jgi:hypothetical protein
VNEYLEKLRSIQFGMVPGAAKAESSKTNYDGEALKAQGLLPSREELDRLDDTFEGRGPLRWENGEPLGKDKNGEYHVLSDRELNQVLYGSNTPPPGEGD